MIGHLGPRVSALLDGQLSPRETEEAWAHVYACHACRDLVEREGWVKTRLAGLSVDDGSAPSGLKGSLLSLPPGERILHQQPTAGPRRAAGVAIIGGGALGAAMLGVIALGVAPGSAPPADRRPPASQINTSVPAAPSTPVPVRQRGGAAPSVTTTMLPAPLRRMLP